MLFKDGYYFWPLSIQGWLLFAHNSIQGWLLTVFKDGYCVGGFRMKERDCRAGKGKADQCSQNSQEESKTMSHKNIIVNLIYKRLNLKGLRETFFRHFFIPFFSREKWDKCLKIGQ
jgi:hypothetical protein